MKRRDFLSGVAAGSAAVLFGGLTKACTEKAHTEKVAVETPVSVRKPLVFECEQDLGDGDTVLLYCRARPVTEWADWCERTVNHIKYQEADKTRNYYCYHKRIRSGIYEMCPANLTAWENSSALIGCDSYYSVTGISFPTENVYDFVLRVFVHDDAKHCSFNANKFGKISPSIRANMYLGSCHFIREMDAKGVNLLGVIDAKNFPDDHWTSGMLTWNSMRRDMFYNPPTRPLKDMLLSSFAMS